MSEEATDTRNWFLRIASGVVFGPVPTKALRLWAEQGRVQPGNEISLDRKNWIPAPSLEELDIVWYLEDSQGNLTGPFNKRAAEKLIADGRVGEGTSIVHKDDADLAHLVRPAMENRRRKPADGAPELDFGEEDGTANADENALRTECEGLRLRVEVLEKSQKQLLAAAEKECKSHERQLEAEHAKIATLEAELEEARLAAATSQNAANEAAAKHEAAAAEKERSHAEALAAATAALETARADAARDAEAHAAESAALRAQVESLQTEYAELLAFSNARDAEARNVLADHDEQADRREKKAAELERRCAEQEKCIAELQAQVEAGAHAAPAAPRADAAAADALTAQIDFLSAFLAEEQKRQKSLQQQIDALVEARSGGLADATERQARQRAELAAQNRNKEELESLRRESARNQQLAETREKELQQRLRMLEIDLSQTQDAAREADALRARVQQLTDALNDRDQIIVQERREHAEDRQLLERAQQALLLRNAAQGGAAAAAGGAPDHEEVEPAPPAEEPPPPAPKKRFTLAPWMTFKK